jgi:hypothetical protein
MAMGELRRRENVRLRNAQEHLLGELFSFMSGLYFRRKLAYARGFAEAPPGLDGAFIITASGGLVPPDTLITLERLRQISSGEVDPADVRHRARSTMTRKCSPKSQARVAKSSCSAALLPEICGSFVRSLQRTISLSR